MTMDRSFPWKCMECRAKAVWPAVVSHSTKIKHENVLYDVFVPEMPVHQCAHCSAITMDELSDAAARAALRDQLRLLQPAAIRSCRDELGMTQQELAEVCGFASESLSRWENGGTASRSSDRLMRVYFGVPQARVFLNALQSNPALGQQVVWNVADAVTYQPAFVIDPETIPAFTVTLDRERRPLSAIVELPKAPLVPIGTKDPPFV
jgi:DNA-binding transcriptional regulator YiaG